MVKDAAAARRCVQHLKDCSNLGFLGLELCGSRHLGLAVRSFEFTLES